MVVDPDAVVDPGAVVVEALYTDVANGAVAGSGCANDLAIRAEICWGEPL